MDEPACGRRSPAKGGDMSMSEPKVLLTGLGIPESPRWHEGRLWFCNWIDRQVVAVGLDGKPEVMLTRDPDSHPMGYSIDWLPDGRLLMTGDKLRRQEPDGSMAVHAGQRANEIVVDGARQHLPQRRGLRLRRRSSAQAWLHQAHYARTGSYARSPATSTSPTAWSSRPDNRTLIISESFAGTAHRVRHRRRRRAVQPAGLRRRSRARTASASTPKARSGSAPGSRSPASPRAAKSCNASNCPRTGPRSR